MNDFEQLLRSYRAQTPVDIEHLIRNIGVDLEDVADLPLGISGNIQRRSDGTYIIRANRNEHEFRRRFTMAHELGHFVLHRSILDRVGGVNDTTMYRTDINAPLYNGGIERIHEQQANSFAANLLMPDEIVRKEFDRNADKSSLYRTFKVSPSAMKWKLHNLRLVEA